MGLWILAWPVSYRASAAARRLGESPEALEAQRSAQRLRYVQHGLLLVALLSGAGLMGLRGWGLGRARWLALKLGLVAFLVVPLEAIHVYACRAWIAPGLVETSRPPFSKRLERGLGMEEMVRALALPLLGAAIPLLLWLALAKPL